MRLRGVVVLRFLGMLGTEANQQWEEHGSHVISRHLYYGSYCSRNMKAGWLLRVPLHPNFRSRRPFILQKRASGLDTVGTPYNFLPRGPLMGLGARTKGSANLQLELTVCLGFCLMHCRFAALHSAQHTGLRVAVRPWPGKHGDRKASEMRAWLPV